MNYLVGPVNLTIPEVRTEEAVNKYIISVEVGTVSYKVRHRYSEFEAMHSRLVEVGVQKDLLPPKKLIGSKDPAFIMKRRKDLETYLQTVYHFLEKNLPQALADFLDFPLYDIHYVLAALALQYHEVEPAGLETAAPPCWSPLQMYAVSERLQSACPPLNTEDKRSDFTNVAAACCRLPHLAVLGSEQKIGSSELVPNLLTWDFLAFKSLTSLSLDSVCVGSITSLGLLRSTLTSLTATRCSLTAISQLLLHSASGDPGISWPRLLSLDLGHNNIETIDPSVRTASCLTELHLQSNSISEVENLTGLPHLRTVDLSDNRIKQVENLHTKVGQILNLKLDRNKIRNLHGLAKLYSVTNLDVSNNKLRTLADISTVSTLPCIENLTLSPNKVNNEVDYRLKVLEGYGGRCGEVVLDSAPASQAELDKVSVLMALRVAREGKNPTSLFGNLPSSHNN